MTKRRFLIAGVVVVLAVGLYLFQPWRLVTNRTASDALLVPTSTSSPTSSASSPSASAMAMAPEGPVAVASGMFRSLEHATTGTASLVRLADGRHSVQFAGLDTSDGPDLHVYLSDKPSDSAEAAFGSGFTSLGKLKGNRGDQVYEIPASADLASVKSVVIWCQRFSAGFGVAPLDKP
ncbi:DM13 domain-containing protein [Lentzea tibetensis]|uniref:DM13 domain-containing protein n=1 Tax=Lentzea tibetensis TaxID=2591470 RepID=A0A563EIK1_9PSEU|nr:DM13 domain-containing protein [Lentzea tibetensis]TWP46145.1 DM13 domain-containing protein [Lentzea tibetensis]